MNQLIVNQLIDQLIVNQLIEVNMNELLIIFKIKMTPNNIIIFKCKIKNKTTLFFGVWDAKAEVPGWSFVVVNSYRILPNFYKNISPTLHSQQIKNRKCTWFLIFFFRLV